MVNFKEILDEKELKNINALPYKVFDLLVEQGLTITFAESITGGDLTTTITSIPGASKIFLGSIVAYSNLLKVTECLVSPKTINIYGPVSSQVSIEMARGINKKFKSDVSISTTGYAGPKTTEEPVGLIYYSIIMKEQELTQKHYFEGERVSIIKQTTFSVLETLKYLLNTNQRRKE
jgi:nicotinamide-nucleotide amidase